MRNNKLTKIGGLLALLGLAVFMILMYLLKPYAGSSGAGMAGLPVAFTMIIALLVAFVGIVMMLVSLRLGLKQKPKKETK